MPTTVCLNMVVKNEARNLGRCLAALRPWIDHWAIIDTGSTDGTPDLIRQCLAGIPGELEQRPWVDFGHNRTEALRLAESRADFILLCDADMVLEVGDPAWKESLRGEAFLVRQHAPGGLRYRNLRVVEGRPAGNGRWRYWGATHEFLDREDPGRPCQPVFLDGISFLDLQDGGSKGDKFERDRRLLESQWATLQGDRPRQAQEHPLLLPRTAFYLAQTYRDLGQVEAALAMYQRRANLGGWEEEVWFARLEIGRLSERAQRSPEQVTRRYLDAYQDRPQRVEPLVELARYHRLRQEHALAHLYARQALEIPMPADQLFLEDAFYLWRPLDEYAVACYWTGRLRESREACERLLASGFLPEDQRPRVARNLAFATGATPA